MKRNNKFSLKTGLGIFSTVVFSLLFAVSSIANDIKITNVDISARNPAETNITITFDIEWSNSFRVTDPCAPYDCSNWDAAWVFIKFKNKEDGANVPWGHATLDPSYIVVPAGYEYEFGRSGDNSAGQPTVGVFIYPDADFDGVSTVTGVELRWNYGANGLSTLDEVDLKVFGIEMVYVPQTSFYVGDGNTVPTNNIRYRRAFHEGGNFPAPFQITSEGAITVGGGAGNLDYTGVKPAVIPAAFPKGYNAYYVMKHSITQQAYVDFLNTLSTSMANTRFPNRSTNRHAIVNNGGVYSTTNPYVAANFLSHVDVLSYLAWAALRPITEFEYEKAARGPLFPVPHGYAWGNASVNSVAYVGQDLGTEDESVTNPAGGATGNAIWFNSRFTDGPARVGIFATGTSTRAGAGSSYWGIMELSGNLDERVVAMHEPIGLAFTGHHGNGTIRTDIAEPLITGWNTDISFVVLKGGSWNGNDRVLEISNRQRYLSTDARRNSTFGGRGGRTAAP